MDLIVKAHNLFIELEQTHPNDIPEWVDGIHKAQGILSMRILRRDYPESFSTIKK